MASGHGRTRRAARVGVILLLFIAAGVRLHDLGAQSLWFDEALSVTVARDAPGPLLEHVAAREQIPPLYHLLLAGWIRVVGDSDAAVRLPAALFGVASVWLTYLVGRRLISPGAGCVAAMLVALSGYHVYYAQESRPYTLLVMTALLSTLALLRVLERPTERRLIEYALAAALLLYAHLYGVFVLVALHAAWLIHWLHRRDTDGPDPDDPSPPPYRSAGAALRGWMMANALAAVLFAPWLPVVVRWVRQVSGGFHIEPFGWEIVAHSYRDYAGGSWAMLGLLALLAAIGLRALWRAPGGAWRIVLAAGLTILPVLAPVVASFLVRPVFKVRYGIVASVGLYLLAGAGWAAIRWQPARVAVLIVLVALSVWTIDDLASGWGRKPDWRSAARTVFAAAGAGDVVAVVAPYDDVTLPHYARRYGVDDDLDVRRGLPSPDTVPPGTAVWLVHEGEDASATAELEPTGWQAEPVARYDGVSVSRLTPRTATTAPAAPK